jgi:hypothetical protein
MNTRLVGFCAFALLGMVPHLTGDNTNLLPSVQFTTDLAAGPWRDRAIVEPGGPIGSLLDAEIPGSRAFYRIDLPQPEIFVMDPAVLGSAGEC